MDKSESSFGWSELEITKRVALQITPNSKIEPLTFRWTFSKNNLSSSFSPKICDQDRVLKKWVGLIWKMPDSPSLLLISVSRLKGCNDPSDCKYAVWGGGLYRLATNYLQWHFLSIQVWVIPVSHWDLYIISLSNLIIYSNTLVPWSSSV